MSNAAAFLDVAERANAQGIPVLPVNANKAPIIPTFLPWKERAQTREEIEAMPWDRAYGIAIMMWPASRYVALDFDGPHAQLAWDEQAKIALPPTTRNRTQSGGFHLIFTTDLPLHTSNGVGLQRRVRLVEADCECVDKDDKPHPCGVDLIVNGYILIQPSPGYSRESGPNLKDSLPLPTEVMEFARRQRDPQPASGLIVRDPGAWLEAALREETPKGRRTDTAARLAGALIARGLNESLVHSLLLLWLQKVEQPAHDPFTPEDLAQVIEGVARTHARNHPMGAEGLISIEDFLAKDVSDRPHVIFPGILPQRGGMVIVGIAGVGKSILSNEIAIDLAFGNPIFGRFPVAVPQRVLILQTENEEEEFHKRLTAMTAVRGVPKGLVHIRESLDRLDLHQERDRQEILRYMQAIRATVLILDPLATFHVGNENDNVHMRLTLDHAKEICRKVGAACIVLHHFGKLKDGQDHDDIMERIRGASGIRDWADSIMGVIKSREEEDATVLKVIFAKVRAGKHIPPFMVRRDDKTYLSTVVDEGMALKCSPDRAAEILRNHGRLPSRNDLVKSLMEETGASRATAYRAVERAFKAGKIRDLVVADGRERWIEAVDPEGS